MPCWFYEKKELRNTPSIQDGLEAATEARYRKEGARYIIELGTKLGIRYGTMATGVVYFHRFYMFHSFMRFPRYLTGTGCLFLAGKVEETPKKCKDMVKTAKTVLKEHNFNQFGKDPVEEVMTVERILLQTIKFDLQVDHPYQYLIKYAKSLKGDKVKLQKMVQMAWTFVNDSLCTTLCLQWEPEIIAIALMYLASKLSKFEVLDWTGRIPKHTKWWDMFVEDMSQDLLEDICHQVLDLYQQNKDEPSPPPGTTQAIAASLASKKSRANPDSSSGSTPSKVKKEKKRSSGKTSPEEAKEADKPKEHNFDYPPSVYAPFTLPPTFVHHPPPTFTSAPPPPPPFAAVYPPINNHPRYHPPPSY